MSDPLPPITEALAPAGKKRGRKPGGGKVPGSGRKAGGANKVTPDLREMILTRGKPIELLCDISRGVKIRVGPQAGPGEAQYAYPTMQERAAAAKILIDKIIAAPPASTAKEDGAPLHGEAKEKPTDLEVARWMLFEINKATREKTGSTHQARSSAEAQRMLEGTWLGVDADPDANVLELKPEDMVPMHKPAPPAQPIAYVPPSREEQEADILRGKQEADERRQRPWREEGYDNASTPNIIRRSPS
jgi:hypothetical protein